ncbi:MAG: competence/damage-inducible protein A [Anaerolineae bacterium]
MPTCSLLAIGNELLNGEIRDRNLYTLSRRMTRLGFTVNAAVIARDESTTIREAVRFLLNPEPDLLICTGGLGPTQDDLTLKALAKALQRPLEDSDQARRLVEEQYERLFARGYLHHAGPEVAREKMARVPEGATPLPNPIGTAPGVLMEHQTTLVYVLPGVPAEMEAILTESILPSLRDRFELGAWAQGALRVYVEDEAAVAQPLEEVGSRHPDVYLKSLARPFPAASEEGLRVIVTAQAPSEAEAEEAVERALTDLRRTFEDAGHQVSQEPA